MSSAIAVGVSLIGLLGMVFTLAILMQMILSFPAMLSSNSRAYVQQQRKLYNIRPAAAAAQYTEDGSTVYLDEAVQGADDDEEGEEERWMDAEADAAIMTTTHHHSSTRPSPGSAKTRGTGRRRAVAAAAEPMARGRTLRRARRRHSTRTTKARGLQDTPRRSPQDETDGEHEEGYVSPGEAEALPAGVPGARHHFLRNWRSVEWTR